MVGDVETSRWSAGGRTSSVEIWQQSLSGRADTLSNSRRVSPCCGTRGYVEPVWLRVLVCEHMCLSGQEGRQLYITHQQALSVIHLSGAQTHPHKPISARHHSTLHNGHCALLTHCRIHSKFLLKDNTSLLSMKRLGAV